MILSPAPKPATQLVLQTSGASSLKVRQNNHGDPYIQLNFSSSAAAVNFARAYMGNTNNVNGKSVCFAKTKGMAAFKKMGIQIMHGRGRDIYNTFTLVTQENPPVQQPRPIVFNPQHGNPRRRNNGGNHGKPKVQIKFTF